MKNERRMRKGLLVLALCVLMTVLLSFAASADDLQWNLLTDKDAGYEVQKFGGFSGNVEVIDENGDLCVQNTDTRKNGSYYIYDTSNILGSYRTFSLEGDFYFESFPEGTRKDGDMVRGPKEAPMSFLCWSYKTVDGETTYFNALRIDDEGCLYLPNRYNTEKSSVRLEVGKWYNIRIHFTPQNGVSELYIDDEKAADFLIIAFDSEKFVSNFVRYFDGFFSWGAKMKNIIVKTDSDYVVGLSREEAADFIGYQTTKPQGGSFALRPILGVNGTEYNRVGYELLTLSMDDEGTVLSESASRREKTVYEAVKDASGKSYSVKELFGYDYAAAMEVGDLPFEPGTGYLEFVVRPYVLGMDGLRRYGDSVVLSYYGETDEEGYPVLERRDERVVKLAPSDDTFIYAGTAWGNTAFGDYTRLQMKNMDPTNIAPERASYIKFTLSPEQVKMVESAVSAHLCINTASAAPLEILVNGTSTEWSGTTLTYNNHPQLAKTQEQVFRGEVKNGQYVYVDVFSYLTEQMLEEDGSLTVSFRITTVGDPNATLAYIESTEGAESTRPYLEVANTIYEQELKSFKISNFGYEPWGYAEMLVDEWFDELKDKIYKKDANGNLIEYEVNATAPEGYNATAPAGDFTEELPWLMPYVWTNKAGVKKESEWAKNKFARTLSTLGTSTANAYLASEFSAVTTEYDVYGGMTNAGFRGQATGFFHTEVFGGKTYIIDPLGNPYFSVGMNDITLRNKQFVTEKYGSTDDFFENATRQLQEMGINAAYESEIAELLAVEDGLSVVVALKGVPGYMATLGITPVSEGVYPHNNTLNVFDPDFVKWANKNIPAVITAGGYADNPRVLGYTTDNELPSGEDMLYRYLTLDAAEPATAFSYATAWTWLARRMNTPAPTLLDYMTSPDMAEMNSEFMSFVYATYYRVCREAIETVDKNHMYLGSRANLFCREDLGYLKAAGYYLDIITTNIYGGLYYDWDMMVNFYRYSGKPFLVTEFFAKSMDAIDDHGFIMGNSTGAGFVVNTQQDRADFYEHHALACIESGTCVGWTWYRYLDNDPPLIYSYDLQKELVMAYVDFSAQKAVTYLDKDGNQYTAAQAGIVDTIDEGDLMMSNLNVNKGVINRNYTSTVAVYTYDASGKLLGSKSYHVEHPDSAEPTDGTVLMALDGSQSFMIGRVATSDGGYTETVLTTFEGTYVALTKAIRAISDNMVGIIQYFNAN